MAGVISSGNITKASRVSFTYDFFAFGQKSHHYHFVGEECLHVGAVFLVSFQFNHNRKENGEIQLKAKSTVVEITDGVVMNPQKVSPDSIQIAPTPGVGNSERNNESGRSGAPDRGVLKPQSSFSGIKLGPENREGGKRLTFADEHGEVLVMNVFVDQLHYGNNQTSMGSLGTSSGAKCCTIS